MRSTLLNIAAVLGSLCIVLVVLALVFNISLIMFKTGSMAPQIPTGSLAVVKQIPAHDARVGQVVTVTRPRELPITHRVVGSRPGPDGTTELLLKGDANREPDAEPYDVRTVKLVLWSVPGLAYVVVWLGDPFVLGGITIAVAALIVWVLWPRDDKRDAALGEADESALGDALEDGQAEGK
ncbi:S24/S26 family peptidase [Humibacter ginsengisoli]